MVVVKMVANKSREIDRVPWHALDLVHRRHHGMAYIMKASLMTMKVLYCTTTIPNKLGTSEALLHFLGVWLHLR